MHVIATTSGSRCILRLEGRFDFDARREFRAAVKAAVADAKLAVIELDLGGVDYVDSSALGMLLLLREKASAKNIQMKLLNTQSSVRQVLEVANFGRLFTIS